MINGTVANIAPIDPRTGLFVPFWYLYLTSLESQVTNSNTNGNLSLLSSLQDTEVEINNLKNVLSQVQSLGNQDGDVADCVNAVNNVLGQQGSMVALMMGLMDDMQSQINQLSAQVASLQSQLAESGV